MKILYHYCSNDSFCSIIKSRSIWLSSLSLSCDSMEGKLVSKLIAQKAKNDGLSEDYLQKLQFFVSGLETIFDGLGFCLSEEGDLLSQWRGYAADASGVSIGFSKDYLVQLSQQNKDSNISGFTLQKVEYDIEQQLELINPTYIEIKKMIDDGAFKNPSKHGFFDTRTAEEIERDNLQIQNALKDLSLKVLTLFSKLYLLKSAAFREEREWRLISYLVKTGDECLFRGQKDRIIPFREFSLTELKDSSIVEVKLGPKNLTPNYVVERLLEKSEFKNVIVSRSEASYR